MPRKVTLFTGQWADLPLEEVCQLASEMGYDGLELACWGDHFDVEKAARSTTYCKEKRALLASYGLGCWSISMHLAGQLTCDPNTDSRGNAPALLFASNRCSFLREAHLSPRLAGLIDAIQYLLHHITAPESGSAGSGQPEPLDHDVIRALLRSVGMGKPRLELDRARICHISKGNPGQDE